MCFPVLFLSYVFIISLFFVSQVPKYQNTVYQFEFRSSYPTAQSNLPQSNSLSTPRIQDHCSHCQNTTEVLRFDHRRFAAAKPDS